MKISLSLLSVGMIAAAASAGGVDSFMEYTGSIGTATRTARTEAVTTLFSTDFNSYTTGAVCTDLTGATMGQDSWSQYSSSTSAFNSFAITAATAGNKKLKSSWGSTTAATTNFLWQDNAQGGFAGLCAGKGVEVDFDLTRFSNTLSTKKGQTQLRTYDASGTQTACGFIFDNFATGTQPSIRGLAYLNTGTAASTGTYAFTLAVASNTTSMGVSHRYYTQYDACTGFIYWGWDVGLATETGFFFDPLSLGYIGATGQVVNEIDFLTSRNSATSTGSMDIDNVGMYCFDCPAPGAAALIGLAGFASRRRRA